MDRPTCDGEIASRGTQAYCGISCCRLWGVAGAFKQEVIVGKSKTRAGKGRRIPLNPDATKALADWANRFPVRKPEHYVFPACENARIDTAKPDYSQVDASRAIKSWRTAWRHARKAAGLSVRFHDLRHTSITKLAETQASDETIMSIAGHVSKKMLDHYSHIRNAAKRAAVNAIAINRPKTDENAVWGGGAKPGYATKYTTQ
jgi:integrase